MSVIILIIIHKPDPSKAELKSLEQCCKILKQHTKVLICPKGLNLKAYMNVAPDINIHQIDPKWLSTYRNFNKLKMSPLLYKTFKKYKFILFYELDAWVFRDDLDYWCKQNYDYIGAPWYEGFGQADTESVFLGVGNGGFSLRKTTAHLKTLYSFNYLESPILLMKKTFASRGINYRSILHVIADFTFRNNTFYLFNNYIGNEDIFWGMKIPSISKIFKVTDEITASKFSLELNAPILYSRNNMLPFGCHAWEKYNKQFWLNFIKI